MRPNLSRQIRALLLALAVSGGCASAAALAEEKMGRIDSSNPASQTYRVETRPLRLDAKDFYRQGKPESRLLDSSTIESGSPLDAEKGECQRQGRGDGRNPKLLLGISSFLSHPTLKRPREA
jgi:hypothetical protein